MSIFLFTGFPLTDVVYVICFLVPRFSHGYAVRLPSMLNSVQLISRLYQSLVGFGKQLLARKLRGRNRFVGYSYSVQLSAA